MLFAHTFIIVGFGIDANADAGARFHVQTNSNRETNDNNIEFYLTRVSLIVRRRQQ